MSNTPKRPIFFKRQLVVDPVFQREATWFFLFSAFMGMLSFIGGWMFLGLRFFRSLSVIIDAVSEEDRQQLFSAWNEVFWLSIVFSILFCVAIAILGLYFTNRVAGPIHRISLDLKKMIDSGNFGEISVRKNDFFQDHVKVVNEAISKAKNSARNS